LKSGLDLAQVSGIACLGASSQRLVEAGANLPDECVQGQVLVAVVHNEDLARLGLCPPCCVERDQVPPSVRRPDWKHANMQGGGFERAGDVHSNLSACEEWLGVPRRNDVQLAVVVELAHGEQRVPCSRRPEGERMFELLPLGLRRPASRQQSMRMLASDPELRGKIGDRQSLTTQERLPDLGFITHLATIVTSAREYLCGGQFLDRGEDLGE
jgi:hypothetical protein